MQQVVQQKSTSCHGGKKLTGGCFSHVSLSFMASCVSLMAFRVSKLSSSKKVVSLISMLMNLMKEALSCVFILSALIAAR